MRAAAIASELDRRFAHVLEPRMRVQLLRERLAELAAVPAAELLAHVLDRAPRGGSAVDVLRETAIVLLTLPVPDEGSHDAEPIPYEQRSEIYAAASEAGHESLTRLLRSARQTQEEAGGQRRLPPEVAEIPLGRRRSLAKGDDPLLLEKLALDPDPLVIANLLRNPRIREQDVVRIAALRPVPASTLEEIGRSDRWAKSTRVRVALARNPHTPVELATRALGAIPLPDLREMRGDPGLPEDTKRQVIAELERRSPPEA